MSDAIETAESPANGLSVSEAAARLKVSEKTLLRRIKSGLVKAEKKPLPDGGQGWRVYLDGAPDTEKDTHRTSAPEPQRTEERTEERTKSERAGTVPEVAPDKTSATDTAPEQEKTIAPEVSDTRAGTEKDNASAELLTHLKEENRFLRRLVEQRDRDAAELRAALREALKAMPKAIEQGSAQPAPEAPQSARIEAYAPTFDGVSKEAPEVEMVPQKSQESPRRGDGLRLVRDGLRRIFGR